MAVVDDFAVLFKNRNERYWLSYEISLRSLKTTV